MKKNELKERLEKYIEVLEFERRFFEQVNECAMTMYERDYSEGAMVSYNNSLQLFLKVYGECYGKYDK